MDLWKGDFSAHTDGWAGAFTFPRELFLKGGAVCQRPVEELALLRKKELFSGPLRLLPGRRNNLSGAAGDCLEIAFTIPRTGAPLTMHLRAAAGGEEKIVLQWDPPSRTFTLDGGNGGGRPEKIAIPLGEDGGNDIDLRILVDRSSLELFFCGGKYSAASWIFPRPSSLFYDVFTGGGEIFIPDMRIAVLG
jgi:sucrose-6-phosphate hydrolase SacC (GH32 family)